MKFWDIFKRFEAKQPEKKMIKNEQILRAAQNFEKTYNDYRQDRAKFLGSKFNFLPQWLEKQSTMFLTERRDVSKKHMKFKRGALVFVEFGVNIGSELSNRHWAIVLNKKDTPNNKILTVIPVSSKNKKFSVEIDGFIAEKSSAFLDRLHDTVRKEIFLAMHYAITEENSSVLEREAEFYNELREEYLSIYDVDNAKEIHETKLEELSRTVTKVSELVNHYRRFNKTSYAKCEQIQTISKDRIIFINNLDPCGKIKVSDDTLDRIDKQIRNLYIR